MRYRIELQGPDGWTIPRGLGAVTQSYAAGWLDSYRERPAPRAAIRVSSHDWNHVVEVPAAELPDIDPTPPVLTWRDYVHMAVGDLREALKLAPAVLRHPLSRALQMVEALLVADEVRP